MIEISNITAGYGSNKILKGISLSCPQGSITALIGPNGAGKTTLLKCLCGYLAPWSGAISINGDDLSQLSQKQIAQRIALIPQSFQLQFDYSVRELVLMGRFPYLSYWSGYAREDRQIVEEVLQQLDLMQYADKNFNELSGGEQQRVAIARALVQHTPFLLMDEAFANLDINHAISIMQLLTRINETQKKTIILVSHNINLAVEYCHHLVMLKSGIIACQGNAEQVVTEENLSHVYQHQIKVITNPVSHKPNLVYSGE